MAETDGTEGISNDLADAAEVLVPEPVQLSLLGALEAHGFNRMRTMGGITPAPDDDHDGDPAGPPAPGRSAPRIGRPPGARNKSTETLRRYIFANFGNPLVNAARFATADPRELAGYLNCEPKEALQLVLLAVRIVSEYVNSKMPATVRLDGKGAVAFGVFGQAAPGPEAIRPGNDPLAALLAYAAEGDNPANDESVADSSPAQG